MMLLLVFLSSCDFDFEGEDGKDLTEPEPVKKGDFTKDILPLFTENDVFFDGALACSACHFSNTSASFHELDLGSYNGILIGADAGTEDIMGRTGACVGSTDVVACPPDWDESGLKRRLRNNRMPPGWGFDLHETNRGTPEIRTLEAWVTDGAKNTGCTGTALCYNTLLTTLGFASGSTSNVDVGGPGAITWNLLSVTGMTVGALFTTDNAFFQGGQACADCHGSLGFSWHELDLSSYAGILKGADAGTEDILGRTDACVGSTDVSACPPKWSDSGLRQRMRNNRMPPDWPFDQSEANRDMWAIESIKCWVTAGAPNGKFSCK
jgi:hypothetical protein